MRESISLSYEDIFDGTNTVSTAGESFLYDELGNRRIANASGVTNVTTSTFEVSGKGAAFQCWREK